MAAGLGFKTFTTGEVLSAGDTNGYLMQGINVFASAAARDAAITSPQEGQACYLKDTDAVQTYSGSAWVAVGGSSGASVNLLLNSNFAINQRAYVSAANLASGTYGFDRWKSNFTNTTLTFTASTQGQSLTISASGGLQQIIEQGLVPAGTYTLSYTGTATARVYNSGGTPPAYASSPITFTADGTANVVVEFTAVSTTKTLSKVLFTSGTGTTWSLATPTLQTELAACQRYYYRTTATQAYSDFGSGYNKSVSEGSFMIPFPVTMRITPTALEQTGTAANYNILHASGGSGARTACSAVPSYQVATPTMGRVDFICASGLTSGNGAIAGSNNNTTAYLGWSAEL